MLIALGTRALIGAFRRRDQISVEEASIPLENATQATVQFHYGAGELRIDGAARPGELLTGTFAGGVDQRMDRQGGLARVDLRVPEDVFSNFQVFEGPHRLDWTVSLNPQVPMSLELEVGASKNVIDLSATQVKDLRLSTGASDTQITFPAGAGTTRAAIKSGAASVNVRIPEGVAARITASGGLSSTSVDTLRFPQMGSEYRSADYDSAANRLDLTLETGVGAVTVR